LVLGNRNQVLLFETENEFINIHKSSYKVLAGQRIKLRDATSGKVFESCCGTKKVLLGTATEHGSWTWEP
jgi:hypothetical protein